MGQSVLVFISHSSEDKETLIEPIVRDLEDCYINVWIDKRKIVPGDNLRKSIFRDGLDKADVTLIFFTENSLKSAWVDREIKHVLRDESKKGNDFDLKKIISIFDSEETYKQISDRYPELTDDLLHLMPKNYDKVHLGKLISAIWSKYLALQGGDAETQRKLLAMERQIFQREKDIQDISIKLAAAKDKNSKSQLHDEFETIRASGKVDNFLKDKQHILEGYWLEAQQIPDAANARAFGLIEPNPNNVQYMILTNKGREYFSWNLLDKPEKA
ncbi:MAG: toll/interleukin-1 receptor domain-containing protein [Anaerolineaceae bacterium]|jgi:hypothetical protein|nr:toll/interleukin-1 receptor domain-containing protein [Anaerolineaceae bacterium]